MLKLGCVCACLLYIYIRISCVECSQVDSIVRLSGASNFPSRLIYEYSKKCGIESNNFRVESVKDVYTDPKISKLVKLINEWYSKNNYIGSGVKNVNIEDGNRLHIICDELKVDKYLPIEVHTYTFGHSKSVDTTPPNFFATLSGSKLSGTPTSRQNISNNFILRKLGLSPGKTFHWDHSKWAAIESCGLFNGNSVVKLAKNPKDGTVTLHVYVIENPTKIVGPFLGNILNAYKEPVFGLKFQHINLLSNGVIGTLSTSAGLSNESGWFESRPYKITASITHDILESFVWLQNKLSQPCRVLSLKAFADNSKLGGLLKYNIKLSGEGAARVSLSTGLSTGNRIKSIRQSMVELRSNFSVLKSNMDIISTLSSGDSNSYKFRGKFTMNIPMSRGMTTGLEGGINTGIDLFGTSLDSFELQVRGVNPMDMGKFNTSYDLNLLLCKNIPITLPASKDESRSVQVGSGIIGIYFSGAGGFRNLLKDNMDKVESAILGTLGLVAGINTARIFVGLPIFKLINNTNIEYMPKFDPKITLDIHVPINS